MIFVVAVFAMLALGGAAFAFAGGDERTQKRVHAVVKPKATGRAVKAQSEAAQKRKNVTALLKDMEKNQEAQRKKEKPTMRRRLEQAGFPTATPRAFWIICGVLAVVTALLCLIAGQSKWVMVMAIFAVSFGLPRWVLGFLTARRRKFFT